MAASRSAWRPVAVSLVGGRRSRGIATLSTRGREESVTPDGLLALGLLGMAAPAVPGIAVKTKSLLTGRRGPPVFQLYADLAKLVRKGRVYSRTTTLVFRAGPVVALASLILAALFLPLDGREAPARFAGDMVAFAGLLALGRFALVLAAMDTGSSFEGMGASREVAFAALVEPGLFIVLAALGVMANEFSLTAMLGDPAARGAGGGGIL